MPIYEYRCPSCGADFEKLQKISADPPPCPDCGFADVKKKVSASAFVLKGSGWYKDHYGLKKSASDASSGSASSGSDASSSGSDAGGSGGGSDAGGSGGGSASGSGGGSASGSSTSSAGD